MAGYHLGINLGHDRSAAIVKNGEIIVAIQQERVDRRKHSIGILHQSTGDPSQVQLPMQAIHYCLEACGITLNDLSTISANMPGDDHSLEILRQGLGAGVDDKFRSIPSHHLAHAYSAHWPSGFDEALVMVVDASGSTHNNRKTESYSIYHGRGNGIVPYHHETVAAHLAGLSTLGFVYEYVSRKAGFVTEVGGTVSVPEAGKLMGLAPYGSLQENWHQWIKPKPGSCSLQLSAYDIFLEITALEKRYDNGSGKPYLRPYLVDLAYKVQHELEQGLIHVAGHALKDTGLKKVSLAGGVALNSVANYKLYRQLELDDIFIFPAAGDSGIAAGCALWAYANHEAEPIRPVMRTATLGRSYSKDEITAAIEKFSGQIEVTELAPEEVVPHSAKALSNGHIVARFEQGSEFGPRALGHRSIMVDPTLARMKDVLNARVKFREAFRPFAPVIPQDEISIVFKQDVPAPFMLLVSDIKEEYHDKIPAVTHHDGTGRVQTVTAQDNPYFHQLCRRMPTLRGGPPVILNTSFNVAGQPIVETPEEAIATFIGTNIDYLCIENLWIKKRHVSVLNYRQHLSLVTDNTFPEGLPPNQPAVTDLMQQLDRALFFGETDNCPWTTEELWELSAQGARYKETSLLFPETPLDQPLTSQLSEDVVLILDPLGNSDLIDLSNSTPPLSLDYSGVKWLLAAHSNPDRLKSLRLEQQLTTRVANERLSDINRQLLERRLQVAGGTHISPVVEDSLLPQCRSTLECFVDPAFSARAVLRQLHRVLTQTGYTESAICSALEVESLQMIEPTHLHYYNRYKLPKSEFGDLIRLFQLRGSLSENVLRAQFGEELFTAMTRLGILIPRGERWSSRVDLFCVDDLFIATDHRYMIHPEDRMDEQPVMYLGMDSMGLVHTAPRESAEKVLDLCTGSGVQALTSSRYANSIIGVDLQPRAIRFARFNTQLNGIDNVEFRQGDLFGVVSGEKFDTILANPPFVPSPENSLTFRDGGAEGEAILRRIISEAPEHLSGEGRLHIVTDLVDLHNYRNKLTNWWKGGGADMLVLHTADRDEILFSVPHSHWPFDQSFDDYNNELDQWIKNFRAANLTAVNFGYILIQRRPEMLTSAYFSRCIHNPSSHIHERVSDYFKQRRLLGRIATKSCLLDIDPTIKVRIDRGLKENDSKVELYVEDNPYFTTYGINRAILLELQTIAENTPNASSYIHSGNREWIEDLIGKGVLRLKPSAYKQGVISLTSIQPPKMVSTPIDRNEPALDTTPQVPVIEEIATKTTPTCLSSYLRS